MRETEDLVARTEQLQSRVDLLQQSLQQMQYELNSHKALLAQSGSQQEAVGSSVPTPPGGAKALDAAGVEEASNHRTMPRHWGNPVPIVISNPQAMPPTIQGWVVDRSPDGLCLVAEKEVQAGVILRVQPTFADAHWFSVEVKYCHPERNIWILGCRFLQRLSWVDLALFS